MSFLELPHSAGYTLRRRNYETALLQALSDSSRSSEQPLIITNPTNSADLATGKTLLVLTVLRQLIRDGQIKHVCWVSLGRYHNGIAPYREMLIELANKLRDVFSAQLGTNCPISQLYGASEEVCQQYIGMLMAHVRSSSSSEQGGQRNKDTCGADEVILVLDELTRARHASMFAQLGLRTIVTTRFVASAQFLINSDRAHTAAVIFQVGGLTPQQSELLLTKSSSLKSLPNSQTLRAMERLSGSLRCFHMIASSLHSTDEQANDALLQKFQESNAPLLQSCLHVHLSSMRAIERTSFIRLLMLPHMGPTTAELACRLWKQNSNMGLVRLEAFNKQGLIVFSEDKKSFHVPYDVVEAAAALALRAAPQLGTARAARPPFADDLTVADRIEAAHAVLLYVTDPNLIRHPEFNSLYKASFVSCWEHLLQLHPATVLGNHVERPSPKKAYERLVSNMKRSVGQVENSQKALARILEVVLSIRPECFACHHGEGAYAVIKEWLLDEIFKFVAAYQSMDKKGIELLSYSSVFRSFGAYLIHNDADKAISCVEMFLQVFCAATETVDEADERTNLLQISDAFVFLTRCQIKNGNIEDAQSSMQAATDSFKDALTVLPEADYSSHPDSVTLTLLNIQLLNAGGLHKEAHVVLNAAITECEASPSRACKEILSCYCCCLGDTLFGQKFVNKARKAYEECMAMRLDLYGELHPATLVAMELLGKCCMSSKKHDKAVMMFRRSIDARSVMFGLDHPALRTVVSAAYDAIKILDPENATAVTQFIRPLLRDVASQDKVLNKYVQPMGYVTHGDEKDIAALCLQLMAENSIDNNNEREAKAYSKKALDVVLVNRLNFVVPYYEYGVSDTRNHQLGEAYRHLGSVYQRRTRHHKAAENFQLALVHFISCSSTEDAVLVALVGDLNTSLVALGFDTDAAAFAYFLTDILLCTGTSVSDPEIKPKVTEEGHLSTFNTFQMLANSLREHCKGREAKQVLMITEEDVPEEEAGDATNTIGAAAAPEEEAKVDDISVGISASEEEGEMEKEKEEGNAHQESAKEAKESVSSPPSKEDTAMETAAIDAQVAADAVAAEEKHDVHAKAAADMKAKQDKIVADALADFTEVMKTEEEVAAEAKAAAEKAAAEAKIIADAKAEADAIVAAEAKAIADAQAAADALAAAEAAKASAAAQAALEKAAEEKKVADALFALAKAAEEDKRKEHLIAACLNNDMSDVTVLLQEGADVNTQCDETGCTLLLMACISEHVKMARLLLSSGAHSSISDNDGNSPLLVTCLNGYDEIYDMIVNGGDNSPQFISELFAHTDADGQGPLLVAAQNGRVGIVTDILCKQIIDVNSTDKIGNTPLIAAVLGGHAHVVKLLLETPGVKHSQANDHGDTPLLLAALRKSVPIARSLLNAGANKLDVNADGMTPIDVAVWNNDEELFTLLIHDDHLATSIQSAWRMYRVRKSIGQKVDAHIVQARHSNWAAVHNTKIVKVQTRVRMFIAKSEMKRRQLDSVFERVKGYAIMKIALLVSYRFHKYVKNFRARRARGDLRVNLKREDESAASEFSANAASGELQAFHEVQTSAGTESRDEAIKVQVVVMSTPARDTAQNRSQETECDDVERVPMTPRQKRFAASGLFQASTVQASKAQGIDHKRKIHTAEASKPFDLSLATMLQRGSDWKEMNALLAERVEEARLLAASGEYPVQQALRLKASSAVVLGLLGYFPAAASCVNLMGNTALHTFLKNLSAFDNKKNMFSEILSAHQDSTGVVNSEGELPLHIAVRSIDLINIGEVDVAEYIISALIEANPKGTKTSNFLGNLPLHIALQKHVSVSVISMLLEAHPEGVHKVAHDGKYPMRVAFQNDCSLEVVQKIMDVSGSSVSVAEGSGSALHVAMKHKAPEDVLLDIIEEYPDSLRKTDDRSSLPLHLALKMFNATPSITTKVVKSLIQHNEDAGGIPLLGVYPLQFAMSKNMDVEIIAALVEAYPYSDELKASAEAMISAALVVKPASPIVDTQARHEALLAQFDSADFTPISSCSFLDGKQSREALAKDQAKLRDERLAIAAQERAARETEAALRREKAAKERAELVEQNRLQRIVSMAKMQKQHEEDDAKRQAHLKSMEEDGKKNAITVEASITAERESAAAAIKTVDPVVSQKLARWKKAVGRLNPDQEKAAKAAEPEASDELQIWMQASTYAAPKTPPKTTKDRSQATPGSAVPFNKKVELSPMASSQALRKLLHSQNQDSDDEN